jgi:Methyltransferase domain
MARFCKWNERAAMKRIVERELLDELSPDNPDAVHSRGDLRRLNRLMRHGPIFCAALASKLKTNPQRIAEIGAGDGSLMLEVAARMHTRWPGVRVILVDRQKVVTDATLKRFRQFGWQAEVVAADAFDWLATESNSADAILANLFLHHFPDDKLAELLRLAARRTGLFLACETQREWPSFAVCRFLGLIGCNSLTRHDAFLSMKAGFVGNELSALWPPDNGWQLMERRAIIFTHLFVAQRKG